MQSWKLTLVLTEHNTVLYPVNNIANIYHTIFFNVLHLSISPLHMVTYITCRVHAIVGHLWFIPHSRTKQADLQQICNRSVLAKTDQLQTNLSSAKSVFSLCRRCDLTVWNDLKTADGKQIMSRSAANLLSLQVICSASKSRILSVICTWSIS